MNKRSDGRSQDEKITLLAVSTNPDDLYSLRDILEQDDWQVRQATSCDEALRFMKDEKPAVVACEHSLPDGNWKDLFNLATSLDNPPPFVVLSRHADESLWAEVLNMGGYDVLATPFERNEVSRVVAMASRHGRAWAMR